MELAMIGDQIVPSEDAQISAHDRSIYFGDGVYEAVYVCNGRIFAMDRHMDRLRNSLQEMDMLQKVDLDLIRQRVDRAIAEAKFDNAFVYFQITRGQAPRQHDYKDDWQPGFLLTLREKTAVTLSQATAITHPDWRWRRCDIKSLCLLPNALAAHAAAKAGAYEAILVEENGLVTEGASNSALIVSNGALQTAPLTANVLPGITRAQLLEWAPLVGLEVREESFTVAETMAAEELIISGTSGWLVAITHLDGRQIGDGKSGRYIKKLAGILDDALQG
jgi:D-alanine transaminase